MPDTLQFSALEQVVLQALAKCPLARHINILTFVSALRVAAVVQPQTFVPSPEEVLRVPQKTREQLLEEGVRLHQGALAVFEQATYIDVMQSEEGQRWLSAGVKALSEWIRAEDGVGGRTALSGGQLKKSQKNELK